MITTGEQWIILGYNLNGYKLSRKFIFLYPGFHKPEEMDGWVKNNTEVVDVFNTIIENH
jgi:hypothetical protein